MIQLDSTRLNKLFPFHILIDETLAIVSYGKSLQKICPDHQGEPIERLFKVMRPQLDELTFYNVQSLVNQLAVIELQTEKKISLRGQFEWLAETNHLLFIGSPWFDSMEQVTENNLKIQDFAYHDPLIDLLHVLKNQEITNGELRQVVATVNKQKVDLKNSAKLVEDIAMFPKENPDPLFRLSLTGEIVMMNPAAEKLQDFYYQGATYPTIHFWKLLVTHIDTRQERWTFEAISNDCPYSYVCVFIAQKGYFNIYGRNITEQKRVERELQNRVRQFKSLAENVPTVLYEYQFNRDGTQGFRYVSPTIEKVLGLSVNDFVTNAFNYLHIDDRERFLTKNAIARATLESFNDESRLVTPNRGLIWQSVSSSFSYQTENGDYVFTGIINDITSRKKAEEVIRANEEKYRRIISIMKLGLLELDTENIITFSNEAFSELSGYQTDELLGKKPSDLIQTEASLYHVSAGIGNNLDENVKFYASEVEVKDKFGNAKWWLIGRAPRYDEIGKMVGSMGIHLDLTEHRELELRLIKAREEAEKSAKAKEVFLANMSHEIRTPLNGIIGMVRELTNTELNSEQHTSVMHAQQAGQHLLSIINNILDLSKIEAGAFELERKPFDIRDVFHEAESILKPLISKKDLAVTFSIDRNLANCFLGDAPRIRQVLLNIVNNSIKFTETGFIRVECQVVASNENSQSIKVIVWDSGIGMDENFIKMIFNKFSQENNSMRRKYGGTGLGMAITHELVNLLGGKINVESEKGKGTKFTMNFTFDKHTPAPVVEEPQPVDYLKVLSGKSILLVEDNLMNRLVVTNLLKRYQINITDASHGGEAIEKINERAFDLILMDLQMPVMDGLEATRLIRKNNITIPIVALTANAFKSEIDACYESGMNDFATKPIEKDILLSTIVRNLR
jgi:PAS domain S-box-containing protein